MTPAQAEHYQRLYAERWDLDAIADDAHAPAYTAPAVIRAQRDAETLRAHLVEQHQDPLPVIAARRRALCDAARYARTNAEEATA